MKFIKQARQLIKKNEDCRLKVYDDATGKPVGPGDRLNGHPTIGWGRALDVNGISQNEADLLFQEDIQMTVESIELQNWDFWDSLSAWRRTVLTDMAYNMGMAKLLDFTKLFQALKVSNFSEAAQQIRDSSYFRQTGRRAKQNCYIMKFNKYISHKGADNYFKQNTL